MQRSDSNTPLPVPNCTGGDFFFVNKWFKKKKKKKKEKKKHNRIIELDKIMHENQTF